MKIRVRAIHSVFYDVGNVWEKLRRKFKKHFRIWNVYPYDCEDLVQEALEKAYTKCHTYQPGSQSQINYLFIIGYRRVIDILRNHECEDSSDQEIKEWARLNRWRKENLHHPLSFDAPISGDDWEDFDENRTLHDAIPAKTSDVSGEMIRKERLEILEGIEAKFSEREKQVAELLKEGLNQLEIARELGIGVSSVRSYIDRIREKIFPDYNRF